MNKRKWSNEAHAWADGWEIEWKYLTGETWSHWLRISAPSFQEQYEYRIVPDADGWLPWYGGDKAPVGSKTVVDVEYRNGEGTLYYPETLDWTHDGGIHDIIKYRIHKEAPAKKKVKMECWKVGSYLQWHLAAENKEPFIKCGWVRVPSEDKVIEI